MKWCPFNCSQVYFVFHSAIDFGSDIVFQPSWWFFLLRLCCWLCRWCCCVELSWWCSRWEYGVSTGTFFVLYCSLHFSFLFISLTIKNKACNFVRLGNFSSKCRQCIYCKFAINILGISPHNILSSLINSWNFLFYINLNLESDPYSVLIFLIKEPIRTKIVHFWRSGAGPI